MTYAEWVTHHCKTFAFTDKADAAAMFAWRDLIEAENRGEYDLAEITRKLAAGDYPSFARDHLKAMLGMIRSTRAASYKSDHADGSTHPDYGTCATCESTGRVIVPHLKCVADGRWVPRAIARGSGGVFYTMAVLCHCRLGQWFAEHAGSRSDGEVRRQMGVVEYTHRNPGWQGQRAERRAIELEEARLSAHGEPDANLERLREIMAGGWMKGGPC